MFTNSVETDSALKNSTNKFMPTNCVEREVIYGDLNWCSSVWDFWNYLFYDCQEEEP
jgi:hypothetical protein